MKVIVCLLALRLFASTNAAAQRSICAPCRDEDQLRSKTGDSDDMRPHMSADSMVSLPEPQHKIPKRAMNEYRKGRSAFGNSHYESALDHFQNSIQLDPEFADGHNDLGVVLAKLGNMAEAAIEFQKTLDLAPGETVAVPNLCISQYALGHYQEAIALSYRALNSDPDRTSIRYVLGMSLIAQNGDRKEALDNLEQAASKFPQAHLAAMQILIEAGRQDEAASEWEAFLRSIPNADPIRRNFEAQSHGSGNRNDSNF